MSIDSSVDVFYPTTSLVNILILRTIGSGLYDSGTTILTIYSIFGELSELATTSSQPA